MPNLTKKIIIVAGPNGPGKTTFARSFLPAEASLPRFINADQIAVIRRRFASGMNYFQRCYKHAVDDWAVYDSSGTEPVMIEWGENR